MNTGLYKLIELVLYGIDINITIKKTAFNCGLFLL